MSDLEDKKGQVIPFPVRRPAPPAGPPMGRGVPPGMIDRDRLLSAIATVVDETHNGVVNVGHNTLVLAGMLKEMGDILDAHSVALNHIITLLESGWAGAGLSKTPAFPGEEVP